MAPNQQAGDALYLAFQRVSPHDDTQRALKAQVATLMVDLGELRSLLVAQSIPSISKPMLTILVSWLLVIFFGFSLIAPPNATTTLALVASAFSVACAIFLILELDHPFGGLIHIPSEPITSVKPSGKVSVLNPRASTKVLPLRVSQLRTALAKRSRYMRCRSLALVLAGSRSNSTFSIVPLKYFGSTLAYSNFGTTGSPLSVPISIPA